MVSRSLMSYYLSTLEKYQIQDCETFEDFKNKFPEISPCRLRKILYLKGFEISKDGKIRCKNTEKRILRQSIEPMEFDSPSTRRKTYPKTNCPQCGRKIFLVFPKDPFCSKTCKREYRKIHGYVTKSGKRSVSENPLKPHCPECLGTNLMQNDELSEVMCFDCGFVFKRTN